MNKSPNWIVGLTTVPSRKDGLLPRTLASLKGAGFPLPRLFVDGASGIEWQWYASQFKCDVTVRSPRVRAFGNFVLGLAELYIRNPTCDRFLMVQDDVVMYRNLRQYLDRQCFPRQGYWNLYSAFENDEEIALLLKGGKVGWVEGALIRNKNGQPHPRGLQRGLGALALAFNREGVMRLLSFHGTISKPANVDRGYRLIDGIVVTAMNEQQPGWREWVHAPTLCYHLGHRSTIERRTGQPNYPEARSWRGEEYNALELLEVGKGKEGAGGG